MTVRFSLKQIVAPINVCNPCSFGMRQHIAVQRAARAVGSCDHLRTYAPVIACALALARGVSVHRSGRAYNQARRPSAPDEPTGPCGCQRAMGPFRAIQPDEELPRPHLNNGA
jgi:hypothetical protein